MRLEYAIEPLLSALSDKLSIAIDPNIDDGLVLLLEQKYRIQIEFLEERIVFSSVIGELLPSRFREKVFEDALKANFKSSCFGTLGYNDKQKLLILILSYPIIPPIPEDFVNLFEGFSLKAKAWIEALQASNTRLLL